MFVPIRGSGESAMFVTVRESEGESAMFVTIRESEGESVVFVIPITNQGIRRRECNVSHWQGIGRRECDVCPYQKIKSSSSVGKKHPPKLHPLLFLKTVYWCNWGRVLFICFSWCSLGRVCRSNSACWFGWLQVCRCSIPFQSSVKYFGVHLDQRH